MKKTVLAEFNKFVNPIFGNFDIARHRSALYLPAAMAKAAVEAKAAAAEAAASAEGGKEEAAAAAPPPPPEHEKVSPAGREKSR